MMEEIKKALEGVTPGPWFEGDKWVFVSPRSGLMNEALENVLRNDEAQANARYIAAVNPVAVAELLSTLESLQRENERITALVSSSEAERARSCSELMLRAEAAEAEVKRLRESHNRESAAYTHAQASFAEYFAKNYPGPDTIIYNPNWHAPKLFAAAVSAVRQALASTGGEHHAE